MALLPSRFGADDDGWQEIKNMTKNSEKTKKEFICWLLNYKN